MRRAEKVMRSRGKGEKRINPFISLQKRGKKKVRQPAKSPQL